MQQATASHVKHHRVKQRSRHQAISLTIYKPANERLRLSPPAHRPTKCLSLSSPMLWTTHISLVRPFIDLNSSNIASQHHKHTQPCPPTQTPPHSGTFQPVHHCLNPLTHFQHHLTVPNRHNQALLHRPNLPRTRSAHMPFLCILWARIQKPRRQIYTRNHYRWRRTNCLRHLRRLALLRQITSDTHEMGWSRCIKPRCGREAHNDRMRGVWPQLHGTYIPSSRAQPPRRSARR